MRSKLIADLHPLQRIAAGIVLSVIVYLLTLQLPVSGLFRCLLLWDVFAFTYCALCWFIFFSKTDDQIRQVARKEDGSRMLVFILILLTCFASMLMVLLLILSKDAREAGTAIYLVVAISGILLSWVMVHTLYTFHYAFLYYDDDKGNPKVHAGGLEFPEAHARPTYLDFAYFAFVVGMTFQVSDIQINRPAIRRVVLLHGLLSFGLNTFVVALTINLIAGLRH
ncbi:MAG: DUF1345 domain-containing protein [Pseudobacter sp.]|uniref:DUF1345 domain-containing protein n=1 Tax=Pseudobacter sp. TaxID=2045420 RepID=UPI003F817DFD